MTTVYGLLQREKKEIVKVLALQSLLKVLIESFAIVSISVCKK